jgi:hypothetical protein
MERKMTALSEQGGRQLTVWVRAPDMVKRLIESKCVRYTVDKDMKGRAIVMLPGSAWHWPGCAIVDAQDRANGSELIPRPDRTSFVYRANGNSDPSGDGHGAGLDDWLKDNGMSPRGYVDVSVDRVKMYLNAYKVTIAGKCK